MSSNKIKCEECGTVNSLDSVKCKKCDQELPGQSLDNDEFNVLNALKQISGVGSSRAKNIVKAGYSDIKDLDDIDVESITSIEGIGESIASDIVKTIEETKEKGGLYLCDECGAFVGEESKRCSNCGAIMEDIDDEIDEEGNDDADEDLDETQEEDGSLYLCTNCGSFVSADSEVCKYCGTSMGEIEEEVEEEVEQEITEEVIQEKTEEKEEEDGLFLCTNCGAFVSVKSTDCPNCGFTFSEDIEEEDIPEEYEEEIEPEIPDEEGVQEVQEEIDLEVIDELDVGQEEVIEPEKSFESIAEELNEGLEQEVSEEKETEELQEIEPELLSEIDEEFLYEDEDIEDSHVSKEEVEAFEVEEKSEDEFYKEPESTSTTAEGLHVGDNAKICGNCGWISNNSVEECPICHHEFTKEAIDTELEPYDVEDHSMDDDVNTLKKALGLSEKTEEEIGSEREDITSRDESKVDVCTVCGAFLRNENERCPVCGSLSSETPEIETVDGSHIDYTDGNLAICDACGAFVKDQKERCSICGSDMEFAKKDIEKEEVSVAETDQEEVIKKFFGQTDDGSKEYEEDEVELYLCTSCGAMVSASAETCSICQSDLGESDIEPAESYDHSEVEEEPSETLNTEETLDEELEDQDIDEFEEDYEELEEDDFDLSELMDDEEQITGDEIDEDDLGDFAPTSDEIDLEEDEDEFDIKLNEEIESILKSRYDEEKAEIEDKPDQTESTSDLKEKGLEYDADGLKTEIEDEEKSVEDFKKDDDWIRCPTCKSYISKDSEFCSVCDQSLDEVVGEKETISEKTILSKATRVSQTVKSEPSVVSKSKPSLKKSRPEPDFVESHIQHSLKNILYKAKDYEVPVSSLSLLAFGGIYFTTYRTSDFNYFGELGLILIGLFFGLGILTVYAFKDEIISYSSIGFVGYLIGIIISSFIPTSRYILNLNIPLLASAGMTATALGIFWILDYSLPKKFHYYMLWFSGICILFVAGLTLIFYSVQISHLEYTIILPLGLGSVMVMSGTATWYKETIGSYETKSVSLSKRFSNYQDSGNYYENISKTCPVSEEKAIPYYIKGINSCSMGEYEDSIRKFKKALDLEGDNEAIWNNLGTAYSRVGAQEKAKKCLINAINIDEEYAIAWNNLGNVNFRCGNYSEALECYDKALEIQGDYRDAMLNKSQALIKLSKIKA